jgi:hypothetical protein
MPGIPKAEYRIPKEFRMPNAEKRHRPSEPSPYDKTLVPRPSALVPLFGILISDFFRFSGFGFRILPPRLPVSPSPRLPVSPFHRFMSLSGCGTISKIPVADGAENSAGFLELLAVVGEAMHQTRRNPEGCWRLPVILTAWPSLHLYRPDDGSPPTICRCAA